MVVSRRALILAAAAAPFAAGRLRAGAGPRVLVLGGDLCEIVFALGAGELLVGADDTALWPPDAAALPKVGYLRRVSAEGALSLAPQLVLASPAAGPAAALEQLRGAGLDIRVGPPGEGFAAVGPKIDFVGAALGREAEATELRAGVETRMAAVEAAVAEMGAPTPALFLISLGSGAPMAAGRDTAADAMITLAGGANVAASFAGYKPLSVEAAAGLAPEAIVLPDHAARSGEDPALALAQAGLGRTPAARSGRIVVMDGLKLLGFGPRTPEAVAELARALHPSDAVRPAP